MQCDRCGENDLAVENGHTFKAGVIAMEAFSVTCLSCGHNWTVEKDSKDSRDWQKLKGFIVLIVLVGLAKGAWDWIASFF